MFCNLNNDTFFYIVIDHKCLFLTVHLWVNVLSFPFRYKVLKHQDGVIIGIRYIIFIFLLII
jgi:hypothetical protein